MLSPVSGDHELIILSEVVEDWCMGILFKSRWTNGSHFYYILSTFLFV